MWTTSLVLLSGLIGAFGHGQGHGSEYALNIEALIDELDILKPRHLRDVMKIAERHFDEPPAEISENLTVLSAIFKFSPSVNAILAVFLLSALMAFALAICPPLGDRTSGFLVAFALGSMLSSIWLQSAVEMVETSNPRMFGLIVTSAFCFLIVIDIGLNNTGGNSSSSHQHQHHHSHSSATDVSATAVNDASGLRRRKSKSKDKKTKSSSPIASDEKPKSNTQIELAAVLNVAADALHNVAEGMYVALAFQRGSVTGSLAISLMALHELPHQFGDFALLLKGGIDRSTAIKAQLIAVSGTWIGVALTILLNHLTYSRQWSLAVDILGGSLEFTEVVTPLTTGVFLYVATVGVLPELMSHDGGSSLALIQIVGIVLGVSFTYFLGE